jgi:hypothetical protein
MLRTLYGELLLQERESECNGEYISHTKTKNNKSFIKFRNNVRHVLSLRSESPSSLPSLDLRYI